MGPPINDPVRNTWLGTLVRGNYGEDCWIRSSANLIGIWANNTHEVIDFVTKNHDGSLALVLAPEPVPGVSALSATPAGAQACFSP